MKRALGIDFGERRIGLAVSDPGGTWALPSTTLERTTDRRAIYQIVDLARQEKAAVLILGESRGLDGKDDEAAVRVRRFGAKLERAAQLPVGWVDETLTTVEATVRLREAGLDSREHAARRDAVAAQIILQEALDSGLVARLVEKGAS
jgi:putative Holliday junction resolvase